MSNSSKRFKNRAFGGVAACVACISLVLALSLSFAPISGLIGNTDHASSESYASGAASGSYSAYLNLDINNNFYDYFTAALTADGPQKSCIYFGDNPFGPGTGNTPAATPGTGSNTSLPSPGSGSSGNAVNGSRAVKWRVLSANDTKYSSGGILLFSDMQLGTSFYNNINKANNYGNGYYSFWGTSFIRALLNGDNGSSIYAKNDRTTDTTPRVLGYSSTASSASLLDYTGSSYYSKYFTKAEHDFMLPANTYYTHDWWYNNGAGSTGVHQQTYNITNATSGSYKYTTGADGTLSGPGAAFASTTSDDGVTETNSGDMLFLLDYDDINNVNYGFCEPDGRSYAQIVTSAGGTIDHAGKKTYTSWTDWNDGYLGFSDFNPNGTLLASYLAKQSSDIVNYCWLRPAGRKSTAPPSTSLIVGSSGAVSQDDHNSMWAIRPAFNLNSQSIIYASATAASKISSGTANGKISALTKLTHTGTPAYTVYNAVDQYNQNDSIKPVISLVKDGSDNCVQVKFNNATGSAKDLVMLLVPKSKSGSNANNGVEYQAIATNAAPGSSTTKFVIPDNINLGNYYITVLVTSNSDGTAGGSAYDGQSQLVWASSTLNTLPKPLNSSSSYNGKDKIMFSDIFANELWYADDDKLFFNNPAYVSVVATDPASTNEVTIHDVDTYTVTFTLDADAPGVWADFDTSTLIRTCTVTITKAKLKLSSFTIDTATNTPVAVIDPKTVFETSASDSPKVRIKYRKSDGSYNDYAYPTSPGTYSCSVELDPTSPHAGSYQLEGVAPLSLTIDAERVNVPTVVPVSGNLGIYTGKGLKYQLTYDAAKVKCVSESDATMTLNADKTEVTVIGAGKYKVSFNLIDPGDTVWSDGSGTGGYETEFEVKPKPLTINAAREDGNNNWSWDFDEDRIIEFSISGICEDDAGNPDNVILDYSFYTDPTSPTLLAPTGSYASGVLTDKVKINLGLALGGYTLHAKLGKPSTGNKNINYELNVPSSATGEFTQNFTILAKSITVPAALDWKYSGGAGGILVGDIAAGGSVTYTGYPYELSVKTDLASIGLKVDNNYNTDNYVNGYRNKSFTDYSTSIYTTYVRLIPLNDKYVISGPDQNAFRMISWKIDQALYDLTYTTWDSTVLTYNELYQSIELVNVPPALTPSYVNNSKIVPSTTGGYTARVSFQTTNINYKTPKEGDSTSYIFNGAAGTDFEWTHIWNIEKAKLTVQWEDFDYTDSAGNTDSIKKLMGDAHDKVDYHFYEVNDDASQGMEVYFVDGDPSSPLIDFTNSKSYYAVAVVKAIYADYYEIDSTASQVTINLGGLKNPINITVTDLTKTFNGSKLLPTAHITTTGVDDSNLVLTFKDASGNPISTDGVVDAGTYTVVVSLSSAISENFYIKSQKTYSFVVEKADVDLSNVKWNYDPANPFQYSLLNGAPKVQTVELVGWGTDDLSNYIKSFINYGGTCSASDVGNNYNATYEMMTAVDGYGNPFNPDNFNSFALPAASLDWKIVARKIAIPANAQFTFDNEAHDIAVALGLPEDWQEYIEVIKYTFDGAATSISTAKEAGSYTATFHLKDDLGPNIQWATNSPLDPVAMLTVKQRVVTISGWNPANPVPTPIFANDLDSNFVVNAYKDPNGNDVTVADLNNSHNQRFIAYVKTLLGDKNVRIEGAIADGVEVESERPFLTPLDFASQIIEIERPSFEKDYATYTGSDILFNLKGFDTRYMTISPSTPKWKEVGVHAVRIYLKEGFNSVWKDSDNDREPYLLKVTIYDKDDLSNPDNPNNPNYIHKLDKPTLSVSTDDGTVKLVVDGFDGDYMEFAETPSGLTLAEGTDNRFVVTRAGTYTFKIKLKTFPVSQWKDGSAVDSVVTLTKTLDDTAFSGSDPKPNDSGSIDWSKFPVWQFPVTVAGIALIIAFSCIWSKFDKRRKAAESETQKHNKAAVAALAVTPYLFADNPKLWFGMSPTAWSAIAFVIIGVLVFVLIMMLIARSRCLKAEAACEEARDKREERERLIAMKQEEERAKREADEKAERLRREEEEKAERLRREEEDKVERRRMEEERQKREDDFKMMMMTMMNGINSRPASSDSGDVKTIVSEVVAALLPAMQQAYLPQNQNIAYIPYQEGAQHVPASDEDDETDEEWDMEEDEDEDSLEAEMMDDTFIIEPEQLPKKLPTNFRARLKESSEKNRISYSIIKNEFCAQKSVAYRVCGRVEKIKFHGDIIAVIGIAKRSIKLWLALDPSEFDKDRYFQKDVSEKPRYAKVPMLVRIGSERAQKRVLELLSALFEKFGIEPRRKYEEKPLQELIFTLKGNKLLKDREHKALLCETIHVHDADVLDNDTAENCIEIKDIDHIDVENFESVSLDALDEHFTDGQKVTLEKLKKLGLVSEECNGFRVVAGSRISKPLIIHANEFTLPAVKMIVLTGGRAVQLVQF